MIPGEAQQEACFLWNGHVPWLELSTPLKGCDSTFSARLTNSYAFFPIFSSLQIPIFNSLLLPKIWILKYLLSLSTNRNSWAQSYVYLYLQVQRAGSGPCLTGTVSLAALSHWLILCQQILRDGAIRDRRFLSFVLLRCAGSFSCVCANRSVK